MPDLDKLYEKADKFLQKQKFEAAIETYQEILRLDPNDEEALITLGDLTLKLNRNAEALRYQIQLADYYSKRGDNAKAIATCRKVLKLSPQDVITVAKLAGLLEKSQKYAEALESYREALAHYRKSGMETRMFECLSHITVLDPSRIDEHVEYAELAVKARQSKVATPLYLHAAQLSQEAGDESGWEKFVAEAHRLDPTDEVATIAATELEMRRGNAAQAAILIDPVAGRKPNDLEVLKLACLANLEIRNFAKAQPLCWKLYQADPKFTDLMFKLLDGMIQQGQLKEVLGIVNQLKDRLYQQGKREEYLRFLERVYDADPSNLEVLEFLSTIYNELNKEDGLRRSLSQLFNLYLATENYHKAGDILERILDVDPYGQGHLDRLENLEGHIDPIWYKNILLRLQPPSAARTPPNAAESAEAEKAETLEDLVVEGEMYHQYQLSAKLAETLEKIDRLFPGAETTNQSVRELYGAAGYTPKFKPPVNTSASQLARPLRAEGEITTQSNDDVRRISEITANIYRESTPQAVLHIAVNEIGRALNVSRCSAALGSADRPPVLSVEYCSALASPSDSIAAQKIFAFFMGIAASHPEGWTFNDAAHDPTLTPVAEEIRKLGIRSLHALPIVDKDATAGLLLLEQCDSARVWTPGEILFLKVLSPQIIIAFNNTRLRRLASTLAGTDPETGLLPRSAYTDCLLAEARRSKDQGQPLSVCLLEPENPHALMKSLGDAGVQKFILTVGKALGPTLRQNDISIRYNPLSIVIVFPDTALPQAGLAVEKVRRAIAQAHLNGSDGTNFCAVLCDVPLGPSFDAVDGVTEVINRLEFSLDRAHKEGGKKILISRFNG
jgi:tetratricopeptide (TPR) repeat protein/GGDEF domain-containing protein